MYSMYVKVLCHRHERGYTNGVMNRHSVRLLQRVEGVVTSLQLSSGPSGMVWLQACSCNASNKVRNAPLLGANRFPYSYAYVRLAQSKECGVPPAVPALVNVAGPVGVGVGVGERAS